MEEDLLEQLGEVIYFPNSEIQLNSKLIFSLVKEVNNFFAYHDTTIDAIAQQANSEISSQQKLNFGQLPDFSQGGSYSVAQKTMSFKIEQVRQTRLGFNADYSIKTDIYLPQNLRQSALLLISISILPSRVSSY